MSVKRIVLISLMTVLLCVCSWITIPYTVPFTMQTFGVFCILLLIGGIDGTISILLYIVLGMIGVPVFSGFQGGIGHLFGPTGGYILGFIITGIIYIIFELLTRKMPDNKKKTTLALITLVIGLFCCYSIGTIWFYVVTKSTSYSIWGILMLCVIPYIIPDLIKLGLAIFISLKLKKIINKDENDYE